MKKIRGYVSISVGFVIGWLIWKGLPRISGTLSDGAILGIVICALLLIFLAVPYAAMYKKESVVKIEGFKLPEKSESTFVIGGEVVNLGKRSQKLFYVLWEISNDESEKYLLRLPKQRTTIRLTTDESQRVVKTQTLVPGKKFLNYDLYTPSSTVIVDYQEIYREERCRMVEGMLIEKKAEESRT